MPTAHALANHRAAGVMSGPPGGGWRLQAPGAPPLPPFAPLLEDPGGGDAQPRPLANFSLGVLDVKSSSSGVKQESGKSSSSSAMGVAHVIRRRNVGIPKFLRYLFQILELEDPSVISWAHAGTAFQIRQPEVLAETILPKYFKHNKVSSFQRQLNYFGFKKWTKTQTNVCTFSHPFFLRDDKDKMKLIKRKERANVHPIGPFAAYVVPPGDRSFNPAAVALSMSMGGVHATSNPTTTSGSGSSLGSISTSSTSALASASMLPKPAPVKRQKSSSAAISPRDARTQVAFLASSAAGRRYSTGGLPGADGMAALSVDNLFFQGGGHSTPSIPGVAAAQSSFIAPNLSTVASRKRAAEMGELESNPFQQSGFFFGNTSASAGGFSAGNMDNLNPGRMPSRTQGKRNSLPTVMPPGLALGMPNNFGLQQQQHQQLQQQRQQQHEQLRQHQQQQQQYQQQQQQQRYQQQLQLHHQQFSLNQALRRKSEQFAPADFSSVIAQQQQQQQQQHQQQQTSRVGPLNMFSQPFGDLSAMKAGPPQLAPSSNAVNSTSLMQSAFQLQNRNPHRQSNIFASNYSATSVQYQDESSGNAGAAGIMPMPFKYENVSSASSSATSSPATAMNSALPSAFEGISMLDYDSQEQSSENFGNQLDVKREAGFQSQSASLTSSDGEPQEQDGEQRDYIDVLLESAALEDGMAPQSSPSNAEAWGESVFASSTNSLISFGMPSIQPQQSMDRQHSPQRL